MLRFVTGLFALLSCIAYAKKSPILLPYDAAKYAEARYFKNSRRFYEKQNIINLCSSIKIPGHANCYNGSLLKNGHHYDLFFREDFVGLGHKAGFFFSSLAKIGHVKLNHRFEVISDVTFIELGHSPEDARAFYYNNKLMIIYNDYSFAPSKATRTSYIAELDRKTLQPIKTYRMQKRRRGLDKNWTPILDGAKEKELKLFYFIEPAQIISFNFDNKKLSTIHTEKAVKGHRRRLWRYGDIRGGTPVVKVDDKHLLAFFHSTRSLTRPKCTLYFMGAAVFENKFPYKMVRITRFPLTFTGCYTTPYSHYLDKARAVLFPISLVVNDLENGRDKEILVSLGENDSVTKIIKMKWSRLFGGMRRVD